MKLPGHLGVALLFAAPSWFALRGWAGGAFTALALSTAMLPDVDLVLPIPHHGVTHSFVFVVVSSVLLGLVAAAAVELAVDRDLGDRTDVFRFATPAFLVGAGSHVFIDMFSAPDVASPVEPLWPVWNHSLSVDVIPVHSDLWNFGALAVGVAVHLAVVAYLYADGDLPRSSVEPE